jgi:hypothetical protein
MSGLARHRGYVERRAVEPDVAELAHLRTVELTDRATPPF